MIGAISVFVALPKTAAYPSAAHNIGGSPSIPPRLSRFRYRCGYGVHSPFAFSLITDVIYEKMPYYAYDLLKVEQKKRITTTIASVKIVNNNFRSQS